MTQGEPDGLAERRPSERVKGETQTATPDRVTGQLVSASHVGGLEIGGAHRQSCYWRA